MAFIELALEDLASNLGTSFPDLVLIIIVLACLIVYGLNVRIGLMFSFVTLAFSYIGFSAVGMSVNNILIVLMINMVMLALSFFIKNSGPGAV